VKAVPLNKVRYQDNLAKKRHRRFLAMSLGTVLGALVLLTAVGYAFFFSGWFDIRDIQINGLSESRTAAVRQSLDDSLNHHRLGIPTGRNIIFFSAGNTEATLREKFPFLLSIAINKDLLHTLRVQATERDFEGIWCFVESCSYYDHDGVLIAPAPRSSGFITLTVNDERAGMDTIDPRFLAAVKTIMAGLAEQDIKVKNITIPAGTFTELDASTANGYPIRFSLDSDLAAQLRILKIFRAQHTDPETPYQYLDLRFDGRVYTK
jgi:cell division septal protein FtsQ